MQQWTALITAEPIDEAAVRRAVEAPESGALVLFCGVVRNHDGGRNVLSLDYRAHPDAQDIMAETVRGVMESSGLTIAAAHRVGELAIGDIALYAAVAAAHRKEAFDACAEVVEQIKLTVPIWKRQHYVGGISEWVGL
ncbi:molybdenum cofactor biosynthesis protein MoaE [Homoserinimonas sp. OAct 916]|uniref:molybdenum cofactor biosynthesis protein MoaE n=1 Tax=Homoserinimonas sp. OAct 916 TaxID=2211450 RepID=UPI000DBE9CC0|nr:molybdenum cofactor biosynthesis protein MoaE [Homoserinimonas sp. OAct 916]